MILIIGGTGTVGREVVRQLSETNEDLRVLSRDLNRANELFGGWNVELMYGDLDKPETLEVALQGIDKVFLLSAADPNIAEQHNNVYEAARKNGVPHVVRLSALGADAEATIALARWHGEADQALALSGLNYTILRPSYFAQNFLMFSSSINTQSAIFAPMGKGKVGMIDVRDIAAVATKVLTSPGHENKIYDLTGPEALDFKQAAKILSEEIGRKVQYHDVHPDEARITMEQVGMPDWLTDALLELYGIFAQGHGATVNDTVDRITGRPPFSFDEFARTYLELFKVSKAS